MWLSPISNACNSTTTNPFCMILSEPESAAPTMPVSGLRTLWIHLDMKLLMFKVGGMRKSTFFERFTFKNQAVQNSSDLRIQFYTLQTKCLVEIVPVEICTVQALHRFKVHLYFTHKIAPFSNITFHLHLQTYSTYFQNDTHTMYNNLHVRKQNLLQDLRR